MSEERPFTLGASALTATVAPALLAFLLTCPPAAGGADGPGGPVVVEAAPWEVSVEFDGVVAAEQADPVSVAPEEWAELTVVEVVPHGKQVRRGDTLVVFDTAGLEEKIAEMEDERALTRTAVNQARAALDLGKKSAPLQKELAARTRAQADEDLNYFTKTGRALVEESARFSLKRSSQYLSYAEEELDQLQQMYEADDITEETEEIILQRAKNDVESARFNLESAREQTGRTLEVEIPRRLETMQTGLLQAELAAEENTRSAPLALAKQELDLEKMERDARKAEETLRELKDDLAMLRVEASSDGIVFYGEEENGKWTTAAAMKKKLRPGGKVAAHEIFLTVVPPEPVLVRAVVPEDKISSLIKAGTRGTVRPAALQHELAAELADIDFVPNPEGGYNATLRIVDDAGVPPHVGPGMGCKVRLVLHESESAITIPEAALVERDGDRGKVQVAGEEMPREVGLGVTSGGRVEVLSGLEPGTEINVSSDQPEPKPEPSDKPDGEGSTDEEEAG